ncbi:MAG: UDP-N-acetylglucosamine 2-epimerase (non-hydrolyzing) [Saprospiraceae bacterium]|nr:UDP-N-acetylglucosamine 2-epimerase (non-hydrolyzing) [Saprospiraceae bacterium]MDW8485244.1 UDP-N-acetylglucosamine 2-epimerase (non-hydrolyzing) [Saprospiraceae bacterium]
MTIVLLVGARPNFIKAAPLWRAFSRIRSARTWLVHTGQHQHPDMCGVFFEELGLPRPLRCGPPEDMLAQRPPTRAALAAYLEPLLRALQPDWLVVIGDVTSTAAGAWAAYRTGVRLAHVEAGLRCGLMHMAEEQNRILTDHLAHALFATESSAVANLLREGIAPERIHFVGNVLIDALLQTLPLAEKKSWPEVLRRYALPAQSILPDKAWTSGYALCTFHRAETVDNPVALQHLVRLLQGIGQQMPLLFPVHPRTERRLRQWKLWASLQACPSIALLRPVGYSDFVCLQKNARVVLTDSGGIQEETTVLGIPCLTLRPRTERPITLQYGTNMLMDLQHPNAILAQLRQWWSAAAPFPTPPRPPLWDGQAAERIAQILATLSLRERSTARSEYSALP